jgi:hypothetical protein
MQKNIKEVLRKYIKEVIDEMTGSASVAGYSTPFAFSKRSITPKQKAKRFTKSTPGYELAEPKRTMSIGECGDEEYVEQDLLYENKSYYDYKNDVKKTDVEKINDDTSEIMSHINNIKILLNRMTKLRNDRNISKEDMKSRINSRISKIEKNLIELLNKVKSLI